MKHDLVLECPLSKNPCSSLLTLQTGTKLRFPVKDELKRRVIRKGDNKIQNCPSYFPRLDGMLSYPLSIFSSKNLNEERRRFRVLKPS
jgi:hypothetical protein